MKKNYVPQPMDTGNVQLPAELDELVEKIAKNVHDVWAQSRMEEGWTYGEERSDREKKHPGLIPYDELSEEEKDYDRATSGEAIRLILKMGYTITK